MGDGLTVWVSAQSPFRLRTPLARLLGLPENRIRVITPDVGGAFGVKNNVYREYAIPAILALRLRRPVKWIASRGDEFVTMQQGRDMRIDLPRAARRLHVQRPVPGASQSRRCRPARWAARRPAANRRAAIASPTSRSRLASRPIPPVLAPMRRWPVESVLLIERVVGAAARNWTTIGGDSSQNPYHRGLPVRARRQIRLGRVRARARPCPQAGRLANPIAERDRAGQKRGSALGWRRSSSRAPRRVRAASCASTTARSPRSRLTPTVRATRRVAQIVADQLGVPWHEVVVLRGDTHGVPRGRHVWQSQRRARRQRALGLRNAYWPGRRMAASPGSRARRRAVGRWRLRRARRSDRRVTWADLASAAYSSSTCLRATIPASKRPPSSPPSPKHVVWGAPAVVRIDPDAVRSAQRLICIDDCGRVLNPLLVEGQVVSGIAQGLGQALMEQVVFDATVRSSAPRWATTRSAGRGHASLNDLVLARTVTPAPWNPLGVKGVGGRARSAR